MTAVRDRMSGGIDPVAIDATLVEAARLMRATGVGALPVVGPAGEPCAGILTERDIVVRVLAEGREPRPTFVRDIATMDPFTCAPDEDLETAIERMREHRVGHLPVVDGDRLVGMLSLADVVFERPDEERGALEPGAGAANAGYDSAPATERAAADERSSVESVENPAAPGDEAPTG